MRVHTAATILLILPLSIATPLTRAPSPLQQFNFNPAPSVLDLGVNPAVRQYVETEDIQDDEMIGLLDKYAPIIMLSSVLASTHSFLFGS